MVKAREFPRLFGNGDNRLGLKLPIMAFEDVGIDWPLGRQKRDLRAGLQVSQSSGNRQAGVEMSSAAPAGKNIDVWLGRDLPPLMLDG